MSYLLLIIGFVLLVKGADFFVDGNCSIARALRIPSLIIGLTVVALGTSAPEAAVSIAASLGGQTGIAIGNVVGSNIFNLLVVVGLSALMKPVAVSRSVLIRDIPFALLSCVALLIVSHDVNVENHLSRIDGVVLLIFFALFMFTTCASAIYQRKHHPITQGEDDPKPLPVGKTVLFTLGGLAGIVIGGKIVVSSATAIATSFGVSEHLIGLTIVAIGTSLPELVTSVVAARKGESDISLGNAIGSNIFNAFFILGMASAISPLSVDVFAAYDMIILTAITLVTYLFAFTGRKVSRIEGGGMILLYAVYMAYILMR